MSSLHQWRAWQQLYKQLLELLRHAKNMLRSAPSNLVARPRWAKKCGQNKNIYITNRVSPKSFPRWLNSWLLLSLVWNPHSRLVTSSSTDFCGLPSIWPSFCGKSAIVQWFFPPGLSHWKNRWNSTVAGPWWPWRPGCGRNRSEMLVKPLMSVHLGSMVRRA